MATDKPKSPDLVISAAELGEYENAEPFAFTVAGKPYTLPSFSTLSLDDIIAVGKAEKDEDIEAMIGAMLDRCSAATQKLLRGLPFQLAVKIFDGWRDASGIEPGEAQPSES